MVTELDHNAIKTQMTDILKGNATLYDVTGASGKIRQVNVGHPDNERGLERVYPSIYITNANPLERVKQSGTLTTGSEDLPPLEHNFRYKIIVQAEAKGSRDVEEDLDDWQKIILETLEADHQLKDGGSAIVNSSRPEMVETFRVDLNGKPVQGKIITYLLSQVTN